MLLVRSWPVLSVLAARGELLKGIQEKTQQPLYTEHLLAPSSLRILPSLNIDFSQRETGVFIFPVLQVGQQRPRG